MLTTMSLNTSRMLLSATSSHLRPALKRAVIPSASRCMTVMSKQSAEQYKQHNYYARMEKTGRPVSPHITLYQFPIVVFSSGINRVTGFLMTLGAGGLGAVDMIGGSGSALHLMELIGSQHVAIASFFKFGVSFNILYHYAGGIRHLVWDEKPDLLTNEDAEKSAYLLMGSVTLASIGLALV